jgi:hypothetical protein
VDAVGAQVASNIKISTKNLEILYCLKLGVCAFVLIRQCNA